MNCGICDVVMEALWRDKLCSVMTVGGRKLTVRISFCNSGLAMG